MNYDNYSQYKEYDNPRELTTEEEEKVDFAESCGLEWTGWEDDELSFIGPKNSWEKYNI